jgi:hypothetical protein
MTKRYHITMKDDTGGFAASELAAVVGGTVRSTVQRFNSDGDDLALIDVDQDAPLQEFEDLLEADDNVVSYHVSEGA